MSIVNAEVEVAAAAAQLTKQTGSTRSVGILALSTNAGTTYIGSKGVTAANGFPIKPGAFFTIDIRDISLLYIIGTAADKIRYIADIV